MKCRLFYIQEAAMTWVKTFEESEATGKWVSC
jgi:hypothetical protein